MKKPELLAPAGNMEALKAAVLAGCDAVYVGGKFFGARNFAGNFDDEEMIEAINYAHLYGVKLYVTMNTLVYEKEVPAFEKYALFLHRNNVDAIIIQDIGMMDYLRHKYPELKLHASTQMHIHNVEGVKFVSSLGLERTVVARETPIELLKEMKKCPIELEVFVQGALCVSYSGECLMSSLLNGRSGNRGTCSQCCRMPYDLIVDEKKVNKESYLLSPKDLNCLNELGPLIELGIDSLKIEGRMKRKEYVFLVTSLYRKAIDSYVEKGFIDINEEDILALKKIFNRGFTKGFLNHEDSSNFIHDLRPNHMGIVIGEVVDFKNHMVTVKLKGDLHQNDGVRILGKNDSGCMINKLYHKGKLVSEAHKNDVVSFYVKDPVSLHAMVLLTTDSKQIESIDHLLKTKERKVPIHGKVICKVNEPFTLQIWDDQHKIEVKDQLIEKALNAPTSKERILTQIEKTGDTPFYFETLESDIDDHIFMSISLINALRRKALDELTEKRKYHLPFKESSYEKDVPEYVDKKGKIAFIHKLETYETYKNDFDSFIVDDEELYEKLKEKTEVMFKLPRVLETHQEEKRPLLVGELGSVNKYNDIVTDFSLNVTNSYSVAFLHHLGVKRVTLSYELNDNQVGNIIEGYRNRYQKEPNLELIVSSYPEVMVLKYDLLKTNGINKNEAMLKDLFHHTYKVVKKDKLTTIYHFEKIVRENPFHYFDMGINKIRYEFDQ